VKDYHINIFWSDEDEGYIADVPDLEACSAFGETPAKALAAVERAKGAWLKAARAEGKAIPPPRYRPLTLKALIERSRRLHPPGTGLTSDEVRKRLGIPRRKARR